MKERDSSALGWRVNRLTRRSRAREGNAARHLCDHVGVFEAGSRSKQLKTFMLPADVTA